MNGTRVFSVKSYIGRFPFGPKFRKFWSEIKIIEQTIFGFV